MGLLNRYRAIKRGQRGQKEQESQPVDVSELDELDIDAGDALEAEIAAELKRKRDSHRRSQD